MQTLGSGPCKDICIHGGGGLVRQGHGGAGLVRQGHGGGGLVRQGHGGGGLVRQGHGGGGLVRTWWWWPCKVVVGGLVRFFGVGRGGGGEQPIKDYGFENPL